MENLSGKTVLLGITGGIAAYKMANVASALRKTGAEVHCILTQNATQFITPLTFETLSNNRCIVDTFDRNFQYDVSHVSLAKKADVILIAPATANVIAKLAHGLADDMLTTTVLAARCPKLIAPAMNTAMLENPATQENLATLRRYGFTVIEPATGMLACKDVGSGKLPEPEVLCEEIYRVIAREKDLQGLHITVTAGPTQESLDPVRFLTNHSSGKMGYAIAREAMLRGADVTLISGPVALKAPLGVKLVNITTAQEMLEGVQAALPQTDVLVMAAAVADYRPAVVADQKMKRGREICPSPWNAPAMCWAGWRSTGTPACLSAASPWKRSICWKTARKADQKEAGYDCCQQPENPGGRLRGGDQCGHPDYPGLGGGAAPAGEGRGCRKAADCHCRPAADRGSGRIITNSKWEVSI